MGQSGGRETGDTVGRSSRTIALIGPYLSGKTTLLEAILTRTGVTTRQGKVTEGTTVGDPSPEARQHGMSVTLNVADATFLDDHFTFIDCPGSIEFQHDGTSALAICDAAVIVSEPDPKRVPALQLIMKQLEDNGIPHFLFLNKIDSSSTPVREIIPMLEPASSKPLVLRQIPIWENGIATGFVDLASERAFVYREHAPSEIIDLPADMKDREAEARFHMLEQLADYDDELMEQLLSDMIPPADKVFDDLTEDLKKGVICPVLLGSAEHGHGVFRLLKALRHEVPFVEEVAKRHKLENTSASAFVFKTVQSAHGGQLSLARVLTGEFPDSATVYGAKGQDERISGIFSMKGEEVTKRGTAVAGDTVALGRLDGVAAGETITTSKDGVVQVQVTKTPEPVFATALGLKDRKDEVKLTGALNKIIEEDPSLRVEHNKDTNQIVLLGQGEMHLRVAQERLLRQYGVDVDRKERQVPYKETIRKPIEIRGRHKKQSGGHGQFGDVVVDIKPMPRGSGFKFDDTITGGAIPKQYIPSVELGIKDYLQQGPLGFPVVDVAVTLKDGSFHSVDSSDMAFRQAGRIAMSEGLPKCNPVLLEPVLAVEIAAPSDATPKINSIISQRRGQILGYDARPGWNGWDLSVAHIPASEIKDLIVELRSVTSGVGTYTAKFDHLAELTGRLADQVLAAQQEAAE